MFLVTQEQKTALIAALRQFEDIWYEHGCLKSMFQVIESGDPEACATQAVNWRHNLDAMKQAPARAEHRAMFEPLIQAIDRSIETQDIFDILARLAQRGGPVN